MHSQSSPHIILTHLNWSLARLKEAIDKEKTQYYRDAALHRFKLTYDVTLETIRAFAKQQGENISTDKSCFQWAKEKQWLGSNTNWENILLDYQRILNKPGNEEAEKIYSELRKYYVLINHLSVCMQTSI